MPQPPLPFACAPGQSDRSICHWQIAQTVLWHPVFAGGAGDERRKPPALLPTPALPFGFLPDLTRVKFGSACPALGRRCRIYDRLDRPTPPCPSLALRLRSRAIGPIDLPLAGRSDGPLAPGFWGGLAIRGDRHHLYSHRLPMPFCFLPDLTRVKFGSACPPLGRRYRARPPGQALPNL